MFDIVLNRSLHIIFIAFLLSKQSFLIVHICFINNIQVALEWSSQVALRENVRIWSFSGPYFIFAFGLLNTERYSVSLRIQSKCGEKQTRKTPNTETSGSDSDQGQSKTLGQKEAFHFSSIISPSQQFGLDLVWISILYLPCRCMFIMADFSLCKTK